MALSAVAIKAAKGREKPYKLTEGDGLILYVTPKGGRYWRMNYRYLGKQKTLAFGVWPDTGLADAREQRDAARKLLARGEDPADRIKLDRIAATVAASNSFKAVADEWLAKVEREDRSAATRPQSGCAAPVRKSSAMPRPAPGGRSMSENTINAALRRIGYAQDEMTGHGFRAMAATLLNEMRPWHPDAIERQLAHCDNNAVRRAYTRGEYWDERVRMMQHWSDYLDFLRDGAKVIKGDFRKEGDVS